jgi:hypothetical protein
VGQGPACSPRSRKAGSRTLALAGVGLLAAILLGSIVVAEPINSQFRRRPRERFHPRPTNSGVAGGVSISHARTYVGLAALVCLISAVAYAPPSQGAG